MFSVETGFYFGIWKKRHFHGQTQEEKETMAPYMLKFYNRKKKKHGNLAGPALNSRVTTTQV